MRSVRGRTDPETSMARKQSVRGTSRGLTKLNVASHSVPTTSSGTYSKKELSYMPLLLYVRISSGESTGRTCIGKNILTPTQMSRFPLTKKGDVMD